jgi:uncharacterized protein
METKQKSGLQWTTEDSTNFLISARNAWYKATRDVDPGTLPYIRTYSGIKFCVTRPSFEEICIDDIAHHLSLLCRFTGAVKQFYSVAEHCVRVSYKCLPEHAREGLMHDASEAYYGDQSRPFKRSPGMEGYRMYEKLLTKQIDFVFNLDPEPEDVKIADVNMLATERRDLYRAYDPIAYNIGEEAQAYPEIIDPWTSEDAERKFLMRFYELFGQTSFGEWFKAIPAEEDYKQWLA